MTLHDFQIMHDYKRYINFFGCSFTILFRGVWLRHQFSIWFFTFTLSIPKKKNGNIQNRISNHQIENNYQMNVYTSVFNAEGGYHREENRHHLSKCRHHL